MATCRAALAKLSTDKDSWGSALLVGRTPTPYLRLEVRQKDLMPEGRVKLGLAREAGKDMAQREDYEEAGWRGAIKGEAGTFSVW